MNYRHALLVIALAASLLLSGCVKGNPALPDPSITVTTISPFPTRTAPTVIVPNP